MKLTLCSVIACVILVAGAAAQDAFDAPGTRSPGDDEERGFTVPSEEVDLNFAQPGLISKVTVKNGDRIKVGQVIAEQDTSVEQAALDKEEFLLKSNVQKRAAEAQRDLARVKLARAEKLFKSNNAGSLAELQEAKLELTVSELKVELATEETESKRLEIVRIQKQLERMKLISTVNGVVRKIELLPGEVSDPQKPSITVVRNDPLWVATKLPTSITHGLKMGQVLQVRYTNEEEWREAKIIYFDPVADAASGTQLIHLELPNPENRRAGYEMTVKTPENLAAAKSE